MLKIIQQRICHYKPRRLKASGRQAGVLLALTREADPSIILTCRAAHLSKHAGEVAFPGGMHEPGDRDLCATALREASEEIALPPEAVEIIGAMGQVQSSHRVQVTPWVGLIEPGQELQADGNEVAEIFRIPLRYLLEDPRLRTDRLGSGPYTQYVPAYSYQGHLIWGLTAYVLVEFMNLFLDARISLRPRPEFAEVVNDE